MRPWVAMVGRPFPYRHFRPPLHPPGAAPLMAVPFIRLTERSVPAIVGLRAMALPVVVDKVTTLFRPTLVSPTVGRLWAAPYSARTVPSLFPGAPSPTTWLWEWGISRVQAVEA